jgi:hypothetical protein
LGCWRGVSPDPRREAGGEHTLKTEQSRLEHSLEFRGGEELEQRPMPEATSGSVTNGHAANLQRFKLQPPSPTIPSFHLNASTWCRHEANQLRLRPDVQSEPDRSSPRLWEVGFRLSSVQFTEPLRPTSDSFWPSPQPRRTCRTCLETHRLHQTRSESSRRHT